MKRKALVVLVLVLCVLMALFLWREDPGPSEPKFKGKYYTEWLEQFVEYGGSPASGFVGLGNRPNGAKVSEALTALKAIDVQAVPVLIGLVSRESSMPQQVVGSLVGGVRRERVAWHRPDVRQCMARIGFRVIRAEPGAAVPALEALLSHERSGVRARAADALAAIGPEARDAVPQLVQLLDDAAMTGPGVRIGAMHALKEIQARPEIVLPVMLKYVKGPEGRGMYWQSALAVFDQFGTQAGFMAPQLQELADSSSDTLLIDRIAKTLRVINPASSESEGSAKGLSDLETPSQSSLDSPFE